MVILKSPGMVFAMKVFLIRKQITMLFIFRLQSLDEKVWQAMEIGWTKPIEAPADWDDAKIKAANFNSRALNALFSAVTNEEFKKISSTETVKKAWTIFQTTFEGTKAAKDSKL